MTNNIDTHACIPIHLPCKNVDYSTCNVATRWQRENVLFATDNSPLGFYLKLKEVFCHWILISNFLNFLTGSTSRPRHFLTDLYKQPELLCHEVTVSFKRNVENSIVKLQAFVPLWHFCHMLFTFT